MTSIKIFAVAVFIIGAGLRYWMNRRKFNRKNFTGAEQFRSYEHKTGSETMESVVKIIAWILMVGAVILYFMIVFVGKGIRLY